MYKYDKELLVKMLAEGKTLAQIGKHYNVSRQRIYQVLEALEIPTPHKTKKRMYVGQPKLKWLSRMLSYKKIEKKLRLEYLKSLELPDICPILGIELDYSVEKNKCKGDGTIWQNRDNCPSIDQIIPGAGYDLDNIIVISFRANRIKNDSTLEELKKLTGFYSNLLTL